MAIGSHPISFHLLNLDNNSVLGIFDGKGQTSKLEIKNTSRREWLLKELSGTPGADNHHFELKFRPGTLVTTTPVTLDANTDWKISAPTATSDGISFYLLSTKRVTVKENDRTFVNLHNLSADPRGGARGSRVELKWTNKLEYVGSAADKDLPAGHRVQHLSIVNERGEKRVPLMVRVVSSDRVMNDGVAVNKLTLRIFSLLKQGNVDLYPKSGEQEASKFIFTFDVPKTEEDKAWTLASLSQLKAIKINAVPEAIKPGDDSQGLSPSWWITPGSAVFSLTPTNFIDVTLDNIKTSNPAGKVNLYIHYENIPGYWDGNFVLLVEKSPVGFQDQKVGIGTKDPEKHLHLKGSGDQELMIESTTGDKWTLQSCGDSTGRFEIINRTDTQNRLTILKSGNVGIGTTDPKTKLHVNGKLRVDGDASFDGKLRVEGDASLGGKVGIGTDAPEKHVHVKGDGDQEILIQSTDTNGGGGTKWALQSSRGANNGRFEIINRTAEKSRFTILKDGNIGIGTSAPEKHLHVAGASDQEIMIESTDTNGGVKWSLQSSAGRTGDSAGRFEIINRTDSNNRFTIMRRGGIGIGTTEPTKAALVVAYSGANVSIPLGYRVMNLHECRNYHGAQNQPYSIWSEGRVAAEEFNSVSDTRIKNIQGRSDSATDLCTLLGIEVTDYTYKDVIGKGTGTYKKVIGQQIEKVLPQAVSRVTDVVPDIYQQASLHDGWVTLSTDLKTGDRVKLITEKGEGVHEVLEVTADKFRVDLEHEVDTVFVFGREVNDFVTVDYDAIAMLNVSATQQLKKELDQEVRALRAENAELRATNDALAQRLQLLESRLEATLSVASAANGSNGNGRH